VARERTPAQLARLVALVVLVGIFVSLGIFLAITMWHGDPTDDREDNQPSPSPASAPVR
jgi:hypothetical protein